MKMMIIYIIFAHTSLDVVVLQVRKICVLDLPPSTGLERILYRLGDFTNIFIISRKFFVLYSYIRTKSIE